MVILAFSTSRAAALRRAASLLIALGACTASRPGGAYQPADNAPDFQSEADAGEDVPDPVPDASVDEPDEPDEPDVPVDPQNPLAAYEGSYLMRMDYFSTASKSEAGNTLEVKNRVSNLFFTRVELVNGELRASEQLCFQSYAHQCNKGCNGWKTTVDPRLGQTAAFFPAQKIERVYAVDEAGKLSAPVNKLALGYTPTDAANASALPTSTSDSRVWQLKTPSDGKTSAVLTHVVATLVASIPPGFTAALDCYIDVVQLFVTSFGGDTDGSKSSALAGLSFPIDATGSDLKAIYVAPATGASDAYCNQNQLGGDPGEEPTGFVRFKAAGKFTGCPASAAEYESAFVVAIDPPAP